jgi:hypothetical protein
MTVDATLAKLSTIDKTFVTALIAAVGYLCNLTITSIRKQRDQRLERRAGLMRLHSVLTTMNAAYNIQSGHRNNLVSSLRLRFPEQVLQPYEDFLSASYKSMDPSERELHAIIRGITIHALKPLNTEAQKWLANDTFYDRAETRLLIKSSVMHSINSIPTYGCGLPNMKRGYRPMSRTHWSILEMRRNMAYRFPWVSRRKSVPKLSDDSR